MTNQIHVAPHERVLGIKLRSLMAPTLKPDSPTSTASLDGSAEAVNRFLQELVDMTGQGDSSQSVPVLELHIGDITTITSLSTAGNDPCLSITAFLPRPKQSDFHPLTSMPITMVPAIASEYEFLWHADEGRYVAIRRIPIQNLGEERDLMDAILETSDEATKWFSAISVYLEGLK